MNPASPAASHLPPARDPQIRALLWALLGSPLYRLTFHNFYAARRLILRLFGATLTPTTNIRRTTRIDRPWNFSAGSLTLIGDHAVFRCRAPVRIGHRVTISQLACITTEALDTTSPADAPPTSRIAPVTIHDDAWVAADSLVLPGVTIHPGAVIGARSLVDTDIPAWSVAAGQPAHARKPRAFMQRTT